MKDTARLSVTIPVATKNAIQALAERMGVSEAYATQHLIKIGMTAESIAFGGGVIEAHFPNGDKKILADKLGNYMHRMMTPAP